MRYLIGVDCGGTHIVGQVWTATDHQLIKEVTGGPGNIVLDQTTAMQNLTLVLDQLVKLANIDTFDMILLGIAGVETSGLTDSISETIQKRYNIKTEVISDAKLALLNGLAGEDGALVIAGTGSVVYGRQAGNFLRVGGWGYILGDEGSAYAIGCAALKQVITSADDHRNSSLAAPLLAALSATDISTAVKSFYAQDRKTNAKLALMIASLADSGDSTAISIIKHQATLLANQVLTLYQQFTDPKPAKIAISGSVLQHNALVAKTLISTIKAQLPTVEFVTIPTNNAHAVIYWHRWQPSD